MGIVVVGSINADLGVRVERHPNPGETLLGSGGGISPGGKGANQAVAAQLLGAEVTFIGAVGDDAYAEPALRRLKESGVDLSRVAELDGTTGLAVITVSDDGENCIIVIPGANSHVTADYVSRHAEAIATASIVLLQGEIPADGFAAAVAAASGRVVVNLAPVVPVDSAALRQADPLIVNEHEAQLVLQQLHPDSTNCDDTAEPAQLAHDLINTGFRSVVMTLGAAGCIVVTETESRTIPAPPVSAVDTTGAGDAFAGALVAQLDSGASLIDAATFAVRVGAFAVQGWGAQDSYPLATDTLPS